MINFVEGNFLHIDFGHFLENKKEKFGYKREKDPFVFTPEIAYFINDGKSLSKDTKKKNEKANIPIDRNVHMELSQIILSGSDVGGEIQPTVIQGSSKNSF